MFCFKDDKVKNAHLRVLDGAAERLTLVRADLLDKKSLDAAFRGCEGVFHTASPITDNPVHIMLVIFLSKMFFACTSLTSIRSYYDQSYFVDASDKVIDLHSANNLLYETSRKNLNGGKFAISRV